MQGDDRPDWPWAFWTVAQAATVIAYAQGVRPAGGYPLPVAATADLALASVQLALAALIGPRLFAGRGRAVRAAAAALPFATLAAALAGRPGADALRLTVVIAVWVIALASPRGRSARRAVVLLTLAGPVLWYVALEYGGRDLPLGRWPTLCVPILGVCSTSLHHDAFRPALVPLAGMLAIKLGKLGKSRNIPRASAEPGLTSRSGDDTLSTICAPLGPQKGVRAK